MPAELQSYVRSQTSRSPEEEKLLRIRFLYAESGPDINAMQLEAVVDGKGTPTFENSDVVPSRYRLAQLVPLPPDAYLSDLRQDGQSIYNNGIVTVGQRAVDLELVLGRNGGTIQGTVVAAPPNEAPAYIAVVLVPDAPRRENFFLYKRQDVDATAADPNLYRFSFSGVAPGTYKVFAWDSWLRDSEMDPAVLAPFEQRGIRVNAAAGVTREVQSPLLRRSIE